MLALQTKQTEGLIGSLRAECMLATGLERTIRVQQGEGEEEE